MSLDPLLIAKFSEIDAGLKNLCVEIHATSTAMQAIERVTADARLKVQALMDRRQEIAADVAIIREMMGLR